ncbi:integrase [Actinobacillus minor NM305]|uniref:Integrase n=1 Tax=Actinobacillus minor NM305 TaxID=637911 RepID=C5RZC3_9PAST|nr:site-specific integrase [Actinobacillus minor]EER47991.1 integrase [Actinobacillus minor NM305]MDY5107459.1 site-specific integrase [Actinobacillus minor]
MKVLKRSFTAKNLASLPIPESDVYEVKDESIPHLRLYRYKTKMTWYFKGCFHYRDIREKLGSYPQLKIADAKSLVLERLSQIEANSYVHKRKMTVGQFFDEVYIVSVQAHQRNYISELSKCRLYLLKPYSERTLLSFSHQELSRYFHRLHEKLSSATTNRIIAIYRKFFRLAVENGLLNKSPAEYIKQYPECNIRKKVLNEAQCKQFLTLCQKRNTKSALALALSLLTGMRIGEVISLTSDVIDFADKSITLTHTKNGSSHHLPITDKVYDVLICCMKANPLSHYLFPSDRTVTGHISPPKGLFKALMGEMQLEGFRIHDLRRSFGSLLLEKTDNLQLVAQALNHRSLNTTRRYAHYRPQVLQQRLNTALLFN